MMLEIQVLAWNRHINVDPNPLFLIIGSPTSIHIEDQYRVWTCVAAKHSSNVCMFYTCFKCLFSGKDQMTKLQLYFSYGQNQYVYKHCKI